MTKISWVTTTAICAVLALAGCNKSPSANNEAIADQNAALPALPEAVPMQAGPATAPAPAPSAAALPAAPPVRVAAVAQPSDAYAYADRASGFSDAIGDAPPDYAFDYNGVSPWAWQTSQGDTRFAEPVSGGYRYYYYQPGENYPYLVRDPSYSYAYDGPNLVAIYGAGGALLAGAAYREHLDAASRYRARAGELYRASRAGGHRGVNASNWSARRSEIAESRSRWTTERSRQPEWQAYHQSHETNENDHWNSEREQRAAEAQRFDGWQRGGYRGTPPNGRPDAGRPDQRDDRGRDEQGRPQPDRGNDRIDNRPDPRDDRARDRDDQQPSQPNRDGRGDDRGNRPDRPDMNRQQDRHDQPARPDDVRHPSQPTPAATQHPGGRADRQPDQARLHGPVKVARPDEQQPHPQRPAQPASRPAGGLVPVPKAADRLSAQRATPARTAAEHARPAPTGHPPTRPAGQHPAPKADAAHKNAPHAPMPRGGEGGDRHRG